jgi:hypothetical protein
MNTKLVISIDGPQGSGKTQLAYYLATLLGKNPFVPRGIPAPEIGIRDTEGTRHMTIEIVRETEPVKPELPKVTLGDNVTRKGKPVRVIATDLKHNQFPVVYVHVNEQDEGAYEHTPIAVNAHGSYLNDSGMPHDRDLVGHLPPEPVQPLELWVKVYGMHQNTILTDNVSRVKPADGDERGFRHFREVLPGTDDELEALRQWKESALEAEAQWDPQEIGRALGLTVGQDVRKELMPKIKHMTHLLKEAAAAINPMESGFKRSTLNAINGFLQYSDR